MVRRPILGARRRALLGALQQEIPAGGRHRWPGCPGHHGPRLTPTAEDLASLLFAESHVQSRFVPRTSNITTLIAASGFIKDIREKDDRARLYCAIAVAWLEMRRDPLDMYQAMSLATQLGLPDQTVRMSIRLLTMPGAIVSYRGMAANSLAEYGTREHIPLLEKTMEDKAVLITIR